MEREDVSLFDLVVELNKRKTIREIRALMARLEDAIAKEKSESKSNDNETTDGNPDASRHHTTA